jgi:hypothetical protein
MREEGPIPPFLETLPPHLRLILHLLRKAVHLRSNTVNVHSKTRHKITQMVELLVRRHLLPFLHLPLPFSVLDDPGAAALLGSLGVGRISGPSCGGHRQGS